MHVITEKRIWEAKKKWPQSSRLNDFSAMRAMLPSTDKVERFHVFDIGGNKIRLIASVNSSAQRLYIKHVLDHREYDKGKWRDEQ